MYLALGTNKTKCKGDMIMSKVVAVHKNEEGNLEMFKLDDGRVLSFDECRQAINNGELPDLICTYGKSDAIIIRSQPDGDPSNNLSNLPTF